MPEMPASLQTEFPGGDCGVSPLSFQTIKTKKGGHRLNGTWFMTEDTALPPSMPLPRAMLRFPLSSTAKVMYARMLDAVLTTGIPDINGILFICFQPASFQESYSLLKAGTV